MNDMIIITAMIATTTFVYASGTMAPFAEMLPVINEVGYNAISTRDIYNLD